MYVDECCVTPQYGVSFPRALENTRMARLRRRLLQETQDFLATTLEKTKGRGGVHHKRKMEWDLIKHKKAFCHILSGLMTLMYSKASKHDSLLEIRSRPDLRPYQNANTFWFSDLKT